MADIMSPVTVMFGGSKKKKAPKAPSKPEKMAASLLPAFTPPTHEERLHSAAADEHVNAARDYVAGRISSKQFADRKARAASIMSKTPKNAK